MSVLGNYLFNNLPSGSVTGRAIFLSSEENHGQLLKRGLHILGFPRIIYYGMFENFLSLKKSKFNSEIKRFGKSEHVSISKTAR